MASRSTGTQGAANKARAAALKALAAENQQRFNSLLRQERVAVGLPPTPNGKSAEELLAQRERLYAKIQDVNAELEMFGDDAELAPE